MIINDNISDVLEIDEEINILDEIINYYKIIINSNNINSKDLSKINDR